MDWMLKDLAVGVPQTRHVIVLSADGLCVAQYGAETDTADRLAAACAGLHMLGGAEGAAMAPTNGRVGLGVKDIEGGGV
ncbi:roadblock/LC7 domain-containing protein, partial [Streptomyces goshikiensis]|uniref:roadblock/LC7 domain-containing protein n=1 Tax=Streptomyces goshikiensis TaxID=1942 RepID=UPI0036CD1E86